MGMESHSKKKVEEEKVTNKFKRDESKLSGRQMDNTNRKCIFENTIFGFSAAAVAVGFFGHN